MKTKRFVSVILVFVLMLSLAACEKKASPSPIPTDAPTPTTKPTDTPAPSATSAPTETPVPTDVPATPTPTEEAAPTPTEEAEPSPTGDAEPTPTEAAATPEPTSKPGDPTPTEKPATPTEGATTPTEGAKPTPTEKAATSAPTSTPVPTATPEPTTSVQPATSAYVIENADGKTAGDLSDDWEIKKYADNWIDCGASIGTSASFSESGKESVSFNCWDNGTAFRYQKNYSTDKGYSAIEFDIKGDGILRLRLQLMRSSDGVYTTIDLGVPANNWNHYVVAVSDGKWKVKYNGADFSLADALSYLGITKDFELVPFCDQINFVLDGNYGNGPQTKIYLDNIQFTYSSDTKSSIKPIERELINLYFDDVTNKSHGEAYSSTEWIRRRYNNDAWENIEGGINIYDSSNSGSRLIGLYSGYSTQYMYRYQAEGNGLGTFSHVSVDLGAYAAKAPVKVKLIAVPESGDNIYIMGSADSFFELEAGSSMKNYKFDLPKRTKLKEIYFCVFSTCEDGKLFVDNIKLY